MALTPGILARGPWPPEHVAVEWRATPYEPPAAATQAADAAIAALRARGSPAHDGLSARLAAHREDDAGLALELEPIRWALRLNHGDARQSLAATVRRARQRRPLAGGAPRRLARDVVGPLGARRRPGAVDRRREPGGHAGRELREEWSVSAARMTVEALVCLPHQLVMLVGLAWLADGARGQARLRARRVRVVAGGRRRAGRPRPTSRCAQHSEDARRRMRT